jgi:hypothetical protein
MVGELELRIGPTTEDRELESGSEGARRTNMRTLSMKVSGSAYGDRTRSEFPLSEVIPSKELD